MMVCALAGSQLQEADGECVVVAVAAGQAGQVAQQRDRVTSLRLYGTATRELLKRWTRSVIPVASRPQPGVVLVLTVHVPAIVVLCPLR